MVTSLHPHNWAFELRALELLTPLVTTDFPCKRHCKVCTMMLISDCTTSIKRHYFEDARASQMPIQSSFCIGWVTIVKEPFLFQERCHFGYMHASCLIGKLGRKLWENVSWKQSCEHVYLVRTNRLGPLLELVEAEKIIT